MHTRYSQITLTLTICHCPHSHTHTHTQVNHFVDSRQLTRKDILKKNLHRFTSMPGKAADAFKVRAPHIARFVPCIPPLPPLGSGLSTPYRNSSPIAAM